MTRTMEEIMKLGTETLSLESELIESWNYAKNAPEDEGLVAIDKRRVTRDNVQAYMGSIE